MIAALITTTLALATGNATFIEESYLDGVMERRLAYGEIALSAPYMDRVQYYAAMRDPEFIGRMVEVQCPNGRALSPVLVIDCGKESHLDYLDSIGFAIDLFGRDAWLDCALPGKSAWVNVYPWSPEISVPAGRPKFL